MIGCLLRATLGKGCVQYITAVEAQLVTGSISRANIANENQIAGKSSTNTLHTAQ